MGVGAFRERGLLAVVTCALLSGVGPAAGAVTEPHLFVVTSLPGGGSCAALALEFPWAGDVGLEAVGIQPVVRHFFGNHYVVDTSSGLVQVIDPARFDTIHTFWVDGASRPQDIVLVDPQTAYVSLYDSTLLYKVSPTTGEVLGLVDLAVFADEDGLPEMSMMALDRNHLFVQIQRLDRNLTGSPVPPSYLAVIDVTTDELVDVNPDEAGPPGIQLVGTFPRLKMHRDSRARRLYVNASGKRLSHTGGIEEIDLDALKSLGLLLPEEGTLGDLGAFVMVSPDRGYAVAHSDIAASSHLFMFTRQEGRVTGELTMTFDFIRSMAYDAATALLYFPDPAAPTPGIRVIDTLTNENLTSSPVATGLPPRDLLVAREPTPGGVTDLRVDGFDPATGNLSVSYRPACGAADHNIVWGPLQEVGLYLYSGRDCSIGSSGSYDQLKPGAGSYFFLVVGTDQAGVEGSYGADTGWSERPPDPDAQACSVIQDLSFSCDVR